MTDRIACINPNCRRTASADKHPGSTWILCRNCYRALPSGFRNRWKSLNKRSRRLTKISEKLPMRQQLRPQWFRIEQMYDRSWDRLVSSIIHYHTASEQPVGLEGFLKENGLAE